MAGRGGYNYPVVATFHLLKKVKKMKKSLFVKKSPKVMLTIILYIDLKTTENTIRIRFVAHSGSIVMLEKGKKSSKICQDQETLLSTLP